MSEENWRISWCGKPIYLVSEVLPGEKQFFFQTQNIPYKLGIPQKIHYLCKDNIGIIFPLSHHGSE